jgi:hypothetical protein
MLALGLVLAVGHSFFLKKWFETYNLDSPDAEPRAKKAVTMRLWLATIIVLVGGVAFTLRGLNFF